MNAHEIRSTDAPLAQPDPHRFADGAAPNAPYVALPDEPSVTIAVSGSANEELTHAEMGAFDGDD